MILGRFFKIFFTINFCIFLINLSLYANESIEERVKKLSLELRCMTCQNQSIYDSDAEFSNDIKNIIKSQFEAGKTEQDIKKFLVERYGQYILFKPLVNYINLFLWAFPFILLTIGLFFMIFMTRKK